MKIRMPAIWMESYLNHKKHRVFDVLLESLDPSGANSAVDDAVVAAESHAHHVGPAEVVVFGLGVEDRSLVGLADGQDTGLWRVDHCAEGIDAVGSEVGNSERASLVNVRCSRSVGARLCELCQPKRALLLQLPIGFCGWLV